MPRVLPEVYGVFEDTARKKRRFKICHRWVGNHYGQVLAESLRMQFLLQRFRSKEPLS